MVNYFLKARLFSLCAVSLAATLLFPHPLKAAELLPDHAAAEAAIKGVYDEINADFSRRDVSHMMSYFASDYSEIDEKGVLHNKEQVREGYQKQLGQITTIQSRFTLQNLVAMPGGTQVEMRLHSVGTGEKKILFAHLKGSFTNDLWARDLWVNTPEGWRLQHRQTLKNDLKTHPG